MYDPVQGEGVREKIFRSYLSGIQRKYLNIIFLAAFTLFAVLCGLYLRDGDRVNLFGDILILFPLFPIFLYYIRSQNYEVTVYLLLSGLLLVIYPGMRMGGLHPLGIIYVLSLPNLTVLLLPLRKGRYFLGVYLASLFLLILLGSLGVWELSYPRPVIHIIVFGCLLMTGLVSTLSYRQDKLISDMTYYAFLDNATVYYNRYRLIQDLENRSRKSLIIINADNFKEINDTLGYQTGDRIINTIGQVLKDNISTEGIYRLSGSEYALLTFHSQSSWDEEDSRIIALVQSILYDVSRTRFLEGEIRIPVSVSIGIARDDGHRGSDLLNCADLALQKGKLSKSKFCFYNPRMDRRSDMILTMKWDDQIETAFEENRILPYYQPIYDNRTGVIVRYECLVRMIDKNGAVHLPEDFLDVVQKKKLYPRLTRTVFRHGVQAVKERNIPISLNISEDDISDPFTREYIFLLLEQSNVGPFVQFEILESKEFSDIEGLNNFLDRVRLFGCKVAIDDFGSGYCNFDYLTAIKTDFVKIDGTLINGIDKSRKKRLLVENIVAISRELNIETVAEHVSSPDILEMVRSLGVTCSQGFYLGEPAPFSLLNQVKNPSFSLRSAGVLPG